MAGTLRAYRDGSGRGVRIRYGDLRNWMMRKPVAVSRNDELATPAGRIAVGASGKRKAPGEPSENLALLIGARRRKRRVRGVSAARRAEGSRVSREA
jgi:hypothetical protein